MSDDARTRARNVLNASYKLADGTLLDEKATLMRTHLMVLAHDVLALAAEVKQLRAENKALIRKLDAALARASTDSFSTKSADR